MLVSGHLRAVLQALFVTFLWSTSWILIKIGLGDIPALTFAGLRYSLAFLLLLVYARSALRRVPRALWGRLIALGLSVLHGDAGRAVPRAGIPARRSRCRC